jgi:hypothetical protein
MKVEMKSTKNFEWFISELAEYIKAGFTGCVEVHMHKGGIGSIKEIKVKKPPEEKE